MFSASNFTSPFYFFCQPCFTYHAQKKSRFFGKNLILYFWLGAEQQNDGCHPSEWGETLLLEFLACLYARVLKSPFWAIPHPSCAIFGHTRHTHTLYWRPDTHPCQPVLNVLVTSCPLLATTRTSGDAPTDRLSCCCNSCSEVMILSARVTYCWHLAATVKSKHWVYLQAKRSKELLSAKANKKLHNE